MTTNSGDREVITNSNEFPYYAVTAVDTYDRVYL